LRPPSAIVNIGSYACYQSFPGISAYAAAKGAFAQITRTFALEAIAYGIRVNAVEAGDVVTNLLNTFRDDELRGNSHSAIFRIDHSSC
jgi:NAD(P)-dependent dehydrogenase (short-subunit alcohol dehydrogenase family)